MNAFQVLTLLVAIVALLTEVEGGTCIRKRQKQKRTIEKQEEVESKLEGDRCVIRELRELTQDEKELINKAAQHAGGEMENFSEASKAAITNGHVAEEKSATSRHQSIMKTPESFMEIGLNAKYLVEVTRYLKERKNIDIENVSIVGTNVCDKVCRHKEGPEVRDAWKNEESDRPKEVFKVHPDCNILSPFRTITGKCNNLINPSAGESGTPLARLLPNAYDDGISKPRTKGVDGGTLPCARDAAVSAFGTRSKENPDLTLLVMQWGQFLDHDMSLSPMFRAGDNEMPIECCENGNILYPPPHPECFAICISPNDNFFSAFDQRCINFVRSMTSTPILPTLSKREQMNVLTHYIDASMVYGSTEEECELLRSFTGGRLRIQPDNLLPNQTTEECEPMGGLQCFLAGDERVNEALQLTVTHTLWLREHNRIADYIASKRPDYSDELVFQTTRKIVGAVVQHITYNEFLPIVLGERSMAKSGLRPQKFWRYYEKYDPTLNPSITSAFSTAAYRFGHTLLQTEVRSVKGESVTSNLLRTTFFNPFVLYEPGNLEALSRGLSTTPPQRLDSCFTEEVTEHLFEPEDLPFGMDLTALNIQRGRDHGLPSYNEYRKVCGLHAFTSFLDLQKRLGLSTQERESLEGVYANVNDIDLFIGGLIEPQVEGSLLGPTFNCIITEQFIRLKRGDRFFYENGEITFNHITFDAPFTRSQLKEIKKATLSRVFCNNLEIKEIQRNAFRAISGSNEEVNCDMIPQIELDKFI